MCPYANLAHVVIFVQQTEPKSVQHNEKETFYEAINVILDNVNVLHCLLRVGMYSNELN